ncbi:hypothetical protein SEUCBS139899_005908 [Sporothrix eucalyptigena]|uniref:Uncharacterized protein n=1 Tax=Sporothrix eucalyptigena TaxID=1812306 RepID=A0ABP0AX80_9PEZI
MPHAVDDVSVTTTVVPRDILDEPQFWTLPPWYHCHIQTHAGTTIFWLPMDSKEGQVYAQLTTNAARLPYIIAHCLEVRHTTIPDCLYFQDVQFNTRYCIRRHTPEFNGLMRLARPDGGMLWPRGSAQWEMVTQYYRDHGENVGVIPAFSRPE